MPTQPQEFLLQQLEQAIRSGGAGGLTTAQDMRALATILLEQLATLPAEAGPAVVPNTGQSQREVMSQKAVPRYVGQNDADNTMEPGANHRIQATISDYSAGPIRLVFNSAWSDACFSGNGTHRFMTTVRST